MEDKKINIRVKYTNDQVLEVPVTLSQTVLELKAQLETLTSSKATEQKVIFKGNALLLSLRKGKYSRTLTSSAV